MASILSAHYFSGPTIFQVLIPVNIQGISLVPFSGTSGL